MKNINIFNDVVEQFNHTKKNFETTLDVVMISGVESPEVAKTTDGTTLIIVQKNELLTKVKTIYIPLEGFNKNFNNKKFVVPFDMEITTDNINKILKEEMKWD